MKAKFKRPKDDIRDTAVEADQQRLLMEEFINSLLLMYQKKAFTIGVKYIKILNDKLLKARGAKRRRQLVAQYKALMISEVEQLAINSNHRQKIAVKAQSILENSDLPKTIKKALTKEFLEVTPMDLFSGTDTVDGILALFKKNPPGDTPSINKQLKMFELVIPKTFAKAYKQVLFQHNQISLQMLDAVTTNKMLMEYHKRVGNKLSWTNKQLNAQRKAASRTLAGVVHNNNSLLAEKVYRPMIIGWVWVATSDSRTSDECARMNGKVGIGPDRDHLKFDGVHAAVPLHWGCRCVLVAQPIANGNDVKRHLRNYAKEVSNGVQEAYNAQVKILSDMGEEDRLSEYKSKMKKRYKYL